LLEYPSFLTFFIDIICVAFNVSFQANRPDLFKPVLKTPGKPEDKTILSNIVQKVPVFIVDIEIAIA